MILSQTEKGILLLKTAQLHLETVDIDNAINHNQQLKYPSIMPARRKEFFKGIKNGKFNSLVFRIMLKQCLKQDVKQFLIKSKILKK